MKRFIPLLLLCGPAWADSGMLTAGVANRQQPLDALIAPTACYSERRLRTAYVANKGVNIVRASDSTTTDVGFDAAGYPNKATETTFCNATTCKLVTMYDQCGSNNLTQATDGNRYTRQTGTGGFNASQATAATQTHAGGSNITPATGALSAAAIFNRSAGTGVCRWISENGANNRLLARSAAVGVAFFGGTSGNITNTTAADAAWHAAAGVTNGASSSLNVDGTDQTGTITGNTTAGAPNFLGAASTTCNEIEAIVWDNVTLSTADRAYYVNLARIAWGF